MNILESIEHRRSVKNFDPSHTMPEADHGKEAKEFHLDIPAVNRPFFVKGAGALDWGMQNRLARVP